MPKPEEPLVIRKYPNRRLYNTGTSTYMTLEDLACMVRRGEDITRAVVTQIHVTSFYHPIIIER